MKSPFTSAFKTSYDIKMSHCPPEKQMGAGGASLRGRARLSTHKALGSIASTKKERKIHEQGSSRRSNEPGVSRHGGVSDYLAECISNVNVHRRTSGDFGKNRQTPFL